MTTDANSRNDVGNARRLVDTFGDEIKWVPEWGDWLVWDRTRWARDAGRGQVTAMAVEIAKTLFELVGSAEEGERKAAFRWAEQSSSRPRIEAMIALARADPKVVVTADRLDADPWVLNCENGTVDLQTGRLLDHDPGHLITKSTGVPYQAGADGGAFSAFLQKVQPDDDMRSFLARLAGHALVGQVLEHVLPIFHGDGGNGKGTLTEALLAALGEYASTAPATLLLAAGTTEHPTGLADLQGKRLIVATETDQTRRLNEAMVKSLTGGDTIKARFLYHDYFSFRPSHSVVLVTNHPPEVQGTDHGIWRRLRMVPWSVTIADADIDQMLGDKLRADLPAVLAWAVRGCLDWRQRGLADPAPVAMATTEYRLGEDVASRFFNDRCKFGPSALKAASAVLRSAYVEWCQAEGEEPRSAKYLAGELRRRGGTPVRNESFRGWEGVMVVAEPGSRPWS